MDISYYSLNIIFTPLPYTQIVTFKHLTFSCQTSEMYDTYLLHLKCEITCFIEDSLTTAGTPDNNGCWPIKTFGRKAWEWVRTTPVGADEHYLSTWSGCWSWEGSADSPKWLLKRWPRQTPACWAISDWTPVRLPRALPLLPLEGTPC